MILTIDEELNNPAEVTLVCLIFHASETYHISLVIAEYDFHHGSLVIGLMNL